MKPSHLERTLLRYTGIADDVVARIERLPLAHVQSVRARLHGAHAAGAAIAAQPTLAELDRQMRRNRPVPGI